MEPEIVGLAKKKCRKIVFTPPYHSDLQLIELFWSFIKGNIGCSYSVGSTLQEVEQKLKTEFELINSDIGAATNNAIIESVDKKINPFTGDLIEGN